MNYWMEQSILYANQKNYLDMLFSVYPMSANPPRTIDEQRWSFVEKAFEEKDDDVLIKYLLNLKLFPIKDSYIGFLKQFPKAVKLNPKTVARQCGTKPYGATNYAIE